MSRRVGVHLTHLFFPLVVLSCREGSTDPPSSPSIPFSLSLTAGDRFVYDGWAIDGYGFLVPSSKTTYVWRVQATNRSFQGQANTIFIIDSIYATGSSSVKCDSVYLSVAPNGDLYQYGFLSSIAAVQGTRSRAPQWDRIAAFSLGSGLSWEVGTWDSAGVELVIGEIKPGQDLYSVNVNGVQTVFPGYRVELQSSSLMYSFGVSNAPAAVLDSDQEPSFTTMGRYRQLMEIISAK